MEKVDIVIYGLAGAGKTIIADAIAKMFKRIGVHVAIVDDIPVPKRTQKEVDKILTALSKEREITVRVMRIPKKHSRGWIK